MRGLVLAAPQSGSGKTAITQALIRGLFRRGIDALPAKVGPDYIDPQFLALAAGGVHRCMNLDPWAMRDESLQMLLRNMPHTADSVLVVEGVMGLFDGSADGTGSSADLAAKLNLPVVLVVNAAKQSYSIAALVQGFCHFRADIVLAGVILNQVGSPRHEKMLRAALATHCPHVQVFGAIPRDAVFAIPERHLGLVQAEELLGHDAQQEAMAVKLFAHLDVDSLLAVTQPLKQHSNAASQSMHDGLLSLNVQHLAIAQDAAFRFVYSGQLQAWQSQGHQLSFFSPLANESPNPKADGIFLPGGYPELFAAQLSQADHFAQGMRQAAERGVPIHGECGGYMVLGTHIRDHDNQQHGMLNLLPVGFHLQSCRRALGYRVVKAGQGFLFGKENTFFTGHQFHYGTAETDAPETDVLFQTQDALGTACAETGMIKANVSGSFVHLIDQKA